MTDNVFLKSCFLVFLCFLAVLALGGCGGGEVEGTPPLTCPPAPGNKAEADYCNIPTAAQPLPKTTQRQSPGVH